MMKTLNKLVYSKFDNACAFFSIICFLIFMMTLANGILIKYVINDNLTSLFRPYLSVFLQLGFFIFWCIGLFSTFSHNKKEFYMGIGFLLIAIVWLKYSTSKAIQVITGVAIVINLILYNYQFTKKDNNSKNKIWLGVTILAMMFVFFVGLALINETYGYKPSSAYLNLNSSERYNGNGNVTCRAFTERAYAGSNMTCEINPSLNVSSAEITFYPLVGEPKTTKLKNLTFVAPENTWQIYVQIWGTDNINNSVHVSSAWPQRYYTLEESQERSEKFLLYLLALLGIIFFSVPRMIIDLRNLVNENRD